MGVGVDLPAGAVATNVLIKFNAALLPLAASYANLTDFFDVPQLVRPNTGILAVIGHKYTSDKVRFVLISEMGLAIISSYESPITSAGSIRIEGACPYYSSSTNYGFYLCAWKDNGGFDIDGAGSLPNFVSIPPNVRSFITKVDCSAGNFNFQWLQGLGESATNVSLYSGGIDTQENSLVLSGVVNATTSFDPFNTTANASNSIITSSFLPFLAVYNTCVAPFSNQSAADLQVCAGANVPLTASGQGPIEWYSAATGGTLLATGSSYTYPEILSSNTVYLQNSCSATRTPVTITIITPNAPIILGPSSHCSGDSVTLNVDPSLDPVLTGYSWTNGVINIGNSLTQQVSGSGNYYFIYFEGSNPAKNCFVSSSKYIIINPVGDLEAEQTAIPCASNINDFNTLQVNVNTTVTNTNFTSFEWQAPNLSGGPYAGINFSTNSTIANYPYFICLASGAPNGCVARDTVFMTFNQAPTNSIQSTCTEAFLADPLLVGETVSVTDNSGATLSATSLPISSTTQFVEFIITNVAGCSFDFGASYWIPSASQSTIVNTAGVLSASQSVSSNGYTYNHSWINCSNNAVLSTALQFTPTSSGNYALVLNGSGNCTDTSNCIQVSVGGNIGLTELNTLESSIYPNPTDGEFNIEIMENSVMKILSLEGKLMEEKQLNAGKSIHNLDKMSSGVYLIQIGNKTSRITKN